MADPEPTYCELLERWMKDRDQRAGEELTKKLEPVINRAIGGKLPVQRRDEAQQRVWLAILEAKEPPRLRDDDGFAGWVAGIARNVVRGLLRERTAESLAEGEGEVPDWRPEPEVRDAPEPHEEEPTTLEPSTSTSSSRLWIVPSALAGAVGPATRDTVWTWDEAGAAERVRTLNDFTTVVVGPVHQDHAHRDGPLHSLGTLWFGLSELRRRRCVIVALLPVREEGTPLPAYGGRTSWCLRGSTRELLALAGWRFNSMMKVVDETSLFAGDLERAWRRHVVERDDELRADGLRGAWIGYEHGGVRAGWYSWGRARVVALPFDPARGLEATEVEFIRRSAAAVREQPEVVPVIADLRLGPKGSPGGGTLYMADDDGRSCRLERKEAAYVLAFLDELALAKLARVPDHLIEARLEALGYPEKKLSTLRARVNTKLRKALASWGSTPYDVFMFESNTTALAYPDQFKSVHRS